MPLTDELFRSYQDLRWHLDPAAASAAGIAEHTGRLGRFDADSVREHLAAFRAIEAGIEELGIEDAADELDRTALLDDVRVTIFRLQHERPHERNPAFWMLHLCEALWALSPDDSGALTCLKAIPKFLATAASTLRDPPGVFVETARALTGPATELVSRLAADPGGAADPPEETLRAGAAAEAAIARFRLALDTDLSVHAGEHDAATGAEQFERLLHHQHAVTAGAPELWRYTIRLEEEAEDQLRALAHEAGAGADWRAALARLLAARTDDLAAGGEVTRELDRITEFLSDADVIAPVIDALETGPLPAWLGVIVPHAVYYPLGAGVAPARLLVSDRASTRLVLSPVAAEFGLPGMHLQCLRAEGLEHEVRRHLASVLLRGGWGLYAVELLDEAGYWTDPVERLVARAHVLFHVLLARVDIGLHTHQLSLADALAVLTERLPLEPETALAAARGCLLEPTQATGALIGRRELLRLRDDARARADAGFSPRAHHESVLAFGGLPAPLVRWGMGFED